MEIIPVWVGPGGVTLLVVDDIVLVLVLVIVNEVVEFELPIAQ